MINAEIYQPIKEQNDRKRKLVNSMDSNRNLSNFVAKLTDSFNKEVKKLKGQIKECKSEDDRKRLNRELLNLTGG